MTMAEAGADAEAEWTLALRQVFQDVQLQAVEVSSYVRNPSGAAHQRTLVPAVRRLGALFADAVRDGKRGVAEEAFALFLEETWLAVARVLAAPKACDVVLLAVASFAGEFLRRASAKSKEPRGKDELRAELLKRLMDATAAEDRVVRLRACHMLQVVVNRLEYIEEELAAQLRKTLLRRLNDKLTSVRIQSVYGLKKLQGTPANDEEEEEKEEEEDEVTRELRKLMVSDPSKDVRKAALLSLTLSKKLYQDLLVRIRDASEDVRHAAFRTIGSSVPLADIPMSDRAQLLDQGLQDRAPRVKRACEHMVLKKWFPECESSPVLLLQALDIEQYPEIGSKVSRLLLKHFSEQPRAMLEKEGVVEFNALELMSENSDGFSAEGVFFWREQCYYYQKIDNNPDKSAMLLPNVSDFSKMLVETCKAKSDVLFIAQQLLELGHLLDFQDEFGRRNLLGSLQKLLRELETDSQLIKGIMELMAFVYSGSSEQEFIQVVAEIVSDMYDPVEAGNVEISLSQPEDSEISSSQPKSADDEAPAVDFGPQLKKLSDEEREEAEDRFEELEKRLEKLEFDSEEYNKVQAEMVELETLLQDPKVLSWLRCLEIVAQLLKLTSHNLSDPVVEGMGRYILPAIDSDVPALREAGLENLGLFCLLDKRLAERYLIVFWRALNNPEEESEVKHTCVQSILDMAFSFLNLQPHIFGTKQTEDGGEAKEDKDEEAKESSGQDEVDADSIADQDVDMEKDAEPEPPAAPEKLDMDTIFIGLGQLIAVVCAQMEDLEERFTKVSSSAVLIGDKLSGLDGERSRVLETDELMEALLALNDPSSKLTKSSNRLFNILHDPNQLREASRIVKKMSVFSSELSSPTIAYAVAEIERLSQTTENDLLTEFTNEQQKGNLAGMHKCAESLIEYNDKEKVADRYVWNVMCDRLAKAAGEPAASSLDPIEDLDALFTKILTICTEQFPVIDSVFPAVACDSIRELLVERLFNDPAFGILSFLDQFLSTRRYTEPSGASSNTADSSSTSDSDPVLSTSMQNNRSYVKLLCAAYEKTCAMVSEIETIEKSNQADTHKREGFFNQDNDDHSRERKPAGESSDRERIHTFLNLQMHSLFGNHREKYLTTELDLLQSQFKNIFATVQFPKPPVVSKSKGGTSKSKTSATSAASTTSSTQSPSASSTQLVSSASTTSISSSSFEKDGGVLQLEGSLVFFESLRGLVEDDAVPTKYAEVIDETIERCEIILKDSELRGELVTKVFTSFVASFGDEYLGKITTLAKEILQDQRLTPESALQFFIVTEALLKRIDFLDEQFETCIAPSQEDSPTQLTICQESKRKCLDKLESSISAALQQALTVIEKTVGQILAANQGKTDFLGGQASMSLSSSKACQKCTEYLQPLVETICRVLIEENCDRFLVALAQSFKELYLQHLRKFRFDPDGACMLLRDVSEYRQAFRSPSHPVAVDEIFDLLHEIANVFALPPENLGGFVREGKLATLNKQTLQHIVKRRWDYKTNAEKIAASLKDAKQDAKDEKST